MQYNIVISGVGGQGVLVASQVIANAAIYNKMKVRVGETHGMAQRGGSVIAHVRFGDEVYGSITPEGEGDILMGFEPVETARYLNYMKRGAYAIYNTHALVPVSVSTGDANYPSQEDISKILKENLKVRAIDATALSIKAGNKITSNTVMIGAFAKVAEEASIPLEKDTLLKAVKYRIPDRFYELNKRAFELGYDAAI